MDQKRAGQVDWIIAMVLALVCLLIGLGGVAAWHLGMVKLVTLIHTSSPANYTVVWLFAIAGFALVHNLLGWKPVNLIQFLGVFIGIAGLLVIFEYIFQFNFSIDSLFSDYLLAPEVRVYSRRAPSQLTGGGFLFTGIAYSLLSQKSYNKARGVIVGTLGLIVACIGAFGLLGFFLPVKTNLFFFPETVTMSLFSSIELSLLGTSIFFITNYYNVKHDINVVNVKPLLVFIVMTFFSFLMGAGAYVDRSSLLDEIMAERLAFIKSRLIVFFDGRLNDFSQMFKVLSKEDSLSKPSQSWVDMAKAFEAIDSDIQGIYLVDHSFNIVSAIPRNGGASLKKEDIVSFDKKLRLFEQQLNSFMIQRNPSDKNLYFLSTFTNKKGEQGLLAIIEDSKLLLDITLKQLPNDAEIEIDADDHLLSKINLSKSLLNTEWSKQSKLQIKGLDVTIKITPSQSLVARTLNLPGVYGTFFFGLALSILIGFLVYLLECVRLQMSVIDEYKDRLNLGIKGSKIATWTYDAKTQEIFWDDNAYTLFGYDINFVPPKAFKDLLKYIVPEDRNLIEERRRELLEAKKDKPTIWRVIHPDDTIHYILSRATKFFDEENEITKFAGVCQDITEERRNKKLLQIHFQVARILESEVALKDVVFKILKLLGESLDLRIAAFWGYDEEIKALRCVDFWNQPSIDVFDFKLACEKYTFAKGDNFPGKVWDSGRPLKFEKDLENNQLFNDRGALTTGSQAVFAFPIKENGNLIGVMELFKLSQFNDIDRFYSDLSDFISREIAQFEQRKRYVEARARASVFLNYSKEAFISQDIEGKIKNWNISAEHMLGYTFKEMAGQKLEVILVPEKREEFQNALTRVHRGETVQNIEMTLLAKRGQRIHGLMTLSPIKNNGEVEGVIAIILDISALISTQELLQKSEEKFRDFIETTQDWIWTVDPSQRIIFSNHAVKTMLGYEPEEIIGMNVWLLIAEEYRLELQQRAGLDREQKKGWIAKTAPWKHKNGSIRWLESSATPILDEKGDMIGIRGTQRDVTERINLERIKDEFISVTSHELRTPLTSIRGALGLLIGKTSTPERTKELLEIAYHNSERLISIINDILEINRMEAGKYDMNLKPVDIEKLIHEAIVANQQMASKFGTELIIEDVPKDLKVYADFNKLMQVMANLLSNAVKFSPHNSKVFIKADFSPSGVKIFVRDQGPGISEDLLPHIFEKFARGEVQSSSGIPGTGLGLSICKNIIEHLGGTIDFITKKGAGTTFYFYLPRWYESMPLIRPRPYKELLLPVLIYCEEQATIDELGAVLKKYSFDATTIFDKSSFLSKLRGSSFSAAIIDLDKITIDDVNTLRELHFSRPDAPPVILMSGENTAQALRDKRLFQGLPILGWLEKPVAEGQFSNLLNELKKQIAGQKPVVLHIESDTNLMEVVKSILQDKVQIIPATTLKQAREILGSTAIDLILMNIFMPDGIGTEILPSRNLKTLWMIPVVVFSAVDELQITPESIVKVLNKAHATEQELIDAVMFGLKTHLRMAS